MASAQTAGVPADVSRRSEEEEDNLAGMEQEEVCGYLYVIIYTKNSYMYLSQN